MSQSCNNAICCLMLLLALCKTATQGYLHHYCSVFLVPSTAGRHRELMRVGPLYFGLRYRGKGHLHTSLLNSFSQINDSRGSLTMHFIICIHLLDSSGHRMTKFKLSVMEFHFHGVGCCHYHPELLNMVIKVTSQDSQDCNQTGLPSLNQGERNKEQQIQDQESQKVLTVGKTGSDWT